MANEVIWILMSKRQIQDTIFMSMVLKFKADGMISRAMRLEIVIINIKTHITIILFLMTMLGFGKTADRIG